MSGSLIEQLHALPLLGETTVLTNVAALQQPNPAIISALGEFDARVRYVPADHVRLRDTPRGFGREYGAAVVSTLADRVYEDFPGPIDQTAQRGTVIALRDEFPHYVLPAIENLATRVVTPAHVEPMRNVMSLMQSGTEQNGKLRRLGTMTLQSGTPTLYPQTAEYIDVHMRTAFDLQERAGNFTWADNIFPVLLVYDRLKAERDADGYLRNPDALQAAYITDRIVNSPRHLQANVID